MSKDDYDREKRLRLVLDLVKLHDAPLGDRFEKAYTGPLTTDAEKDKFISVICRTRHGIALTDKEIMRLADTTAEILTTRKLLKKLKKDG